MLKNKPEEKEDLTPFLSRLFVFAGLDEGRIARLAEDFEEVTLIDGERVYTEGVPDDYFYFVYDGKLRLSSGRGKLKRDWDLLIPGDFFGEDILFGPAHLDTAYSQAPSRVIRLKRDKLVALLEENSSVSNLIHTTARSRRMARQEQIQWIGEDEAIYIINRKHDFFLLVNLIFPILLGIAGLPILAIGIASSSATWMVVGTTLILLMIGLGLWFWVDWRNDYYVVTSQRVLYLEKVVLLYDSRQEAPLVAVRSSNTVANGFLRSFIDYGTVVVGTLYGSIAMRRMEKPSQFVAFMNGLQARAREMSRRAEEQRMEELIRARLKVPEKRRPAPPQPPPPPPPPKLSPLQSLFSNFLKVRYEMGDTVTYRKHWVVLIEKSWAPVVVLLLVLVAMVLLGLTSAGELLLSPLLLIVFWTPVMVGIMLWWLYDYIDWRNDIYVVTPDKILDIERKPLSREEKKSASLDSIQSLEHTRVGFLGILFNYGTVRINIGTEQFNFYDVYSPAQVQYEIFDRMYALRQRKAEAVASQERERIVDWLTSYHRQVENLGKIENESDWDIFSG